MPAAWPTFLKFGRVCAGAAFGRVTEVGEAVRWTPRACCLVPKSAEPVAAAHQSWLPKQSRLQWLDAFPQGKGPSKGETQSLSATKQETPV